MASLRRIDPPPDASEEMALAWSSLQDAIEALGRDIEDASPPPFGRVVAPVSTSHQMGYEVLPVVPVAALTITLPKIERRRIGECVVVYNNSALTNTITVAAADKGESIDGAATVTITAARGLKLLQVLEPDRWGVLIA